MTAYVNTGNKGKLNLRLAPSLTAQVITQIPYGKQVTIDATEGDWAKITYDGHMGYVKSEFLSSSLGITKQDLEKIYNSLQNTLKVIESIIK